MLQRRISSGMDCSGTCRAADSRGRLSHTFSYLVAFNYLVEGSTINPGFAQLFHGGFRADRRIIHLFKSVRARFGSSYREDLDVPVIIVINRFPVSEIPGRMHAVG